MIKIGFDRTDPNSRKFYFDADTVLASNPPKFKVWYVDDVTDVDYVLAQNVFPLKRPENQEEIAEQLGIVIKPVTTPINQSTTTVVNPPKVEAKVNWGNTVSVQQSVSIDDMPVGVKFVEPKDEPQEQPVKRKRGRPRKNPLPEIIPPTITSSQSQVAQEGPAKFEYTVFDEDIQTGEELEDLLNSYGEDGWELCGFNVFSENRLFKTNLHVMGVLKRRVL